jgi:hypothetical protein
MLKTKKNLVADLVVPLLLILGAALPMFYQAVIVAPESSDNIRSFYSFSDGLQGYGELKTAWRGRLFSNAMAWQVDRAALYISNRWGTPSINRTARFAIALWTALWFMAVGGVYLLGFKRRAALYILGTFVAISFGYMPRFATTRVYPWDLPALLAYALFLVLFLKNKYVWLLVLLPVATGFKETAAVMCVAFLLAPDLEPRSRWRMSLGSAASCMAVKLGIDVPTGSAPPLFTMETGVGGAPGGPYLLRNLTDPLSLFVLLANAGMLASLFILPAKDAKGRALKIAAAMFAAGNLVFGIIGEPRIWFEMIPFGLYAIETSVYGGLPTTDSVYPPA